MITGQVKKVNWRGVIGSSPDTFVKSFYGERPDWITGSLSLHDARFLFREALEARATRVVEIGSASGFSTAILCHALRLAHEAGIVSADFGVVSYDIDAKFYADRRRRIGDAAREMLPADLLARIIFQAPVNAGDVKRHHAPDEINFLFLDAEHKHPWPTLDLLAILDCLCPEAVVVLHDINLPQRSPEAADWGVKYLFDELEVKKKTSREKPLPNIGRITIPDDKDGFRDQLLEILYAHPWQVEIGEDVTTEALV